MREHQTEVLIVGAGPVGLLTAILLAEAGIETEIIDREDRVTTRSYACALHPRAMRLFARLGLAEALIEQGRRIRTLAFYEGATRRAEVRISGRDGDFPSMLVLPQGALESVLEQRLREKVKLGVRWNHRFDALESGEKAVEVVVEKLGGTAMGYSVAHWESIVTKRILVRTQFLIGADGHNSMLRQRLGIEYERVAGPEAFAACEFSSDSESEDEVKVVLDEGTTSVLWPLPDNRYRWSFQLTHAEKNSEFPEKVRGGMRLAGQSGDEDIRHWVQRIAKRRAPWFSANVGEIAWFSEVAFEHRLAKEFGRDRCWLAGDAAHQTGPVGAQSMNIGLYEAESLAVALQRVLREGAPLGVLKEYDRGRLEEWRGLLGLSGGLTAKQDTEAWVRSRSARILSCLPASGEDLSRLAEQVGLSFSK